MADECWDRKPYGTLYPNIIRRSKVFISITMQKAQSLFKWNFVSVLYQISFAVWCCRAFSKVFFSFFSRNTWNQKLPLLMQQMKTQPAAASLKCELWSRQEAKVIRRRMSNGKVLPSLSFNLIASTRHGRVFAAIGWQRGVQDWTPNAIKILPLKSLNIYFQKLPKN